MLDIEFPLSIVSDKDEAVFAAARGALKPEPADESRPQTRVPTGKIIQGHFNDSQVFAKTSRDYQVYVPAQYDGSEAGLIVFQDGSRYLDRTGAANVLDNLIASGDLKPTIGLFVDPGDLPDMPKGSQGNRSFEYDSINDAYARFLLEEIIPVALAPYILSDDPARRAICGMSSGGICAFNAAWERPDRFGRVISHVGSFTNIRGGNIYPSRVRQNGRKPIRAFLQGGAADLNNAYGNWAIANHDMADALKFRDYDMRFEFGRAGHTFEHAAATMPQTLRWIFR